MPFGPGTTSQLLLARGKDAEVSWLAILAILPTRATIGESRDGMISSCVWYGLSMFIAPGLLIPI
jgi:hypothetical protein